MGLFDLIFTKKEQQKQLQRYWQALTAYQPAFRSWNGNLYENELVRTSIDARARHISKLKVEVLGSAKPALKTKLMRQPNNFQTWSQFLYRLSTILDMQATAFIVPMLNVHNEVIGIFSVLPTSCEILQTESGEPWLRYTFSNGQKAAVEFMRCGIMTKFQYENDIFGTPNTALTETMNLITIENQGVKEAIKNSATYRFMAKSNNCAKAEELAKERRRFSEENFGSEAKGGGLLLFPNTYQEIKQIEAKPYLVNPKQLEIIRDNVYSYFGVNDEIIQNKSVGDAWSAFYEGCIEVFSIQFSEVVTKMLYTENEQSHGAKVMATSNRLQYLNNADKLKISSDMADRGIMTINEIRDIWNLPPVKGGDKATVRGEYYFLNQDGSTTKKDESDDKEGNDNE